MGLMDQVKKAFATGKGAALAAEAAAWRATLPADPER